MGDIKWYTYPRLPKSTKSDSVLENGLMVSDANYKPTMVFDHDSDSVCKHLVKIINLG